MLKVLSNGLRRMTDSELEIVANKLQEWFTMRLTTADFQSYYSSFVGYYSVAPYGAIIMTSLDRGVEESVQSFGVTDTRYTATVSSKSNNAFDNFGDDDDTFSDPAAISITNQQTFYLAQRHYANYTTSTPGFSGQTLQSSGDYYSNLRNWDGTTNTSFNGFKPAEMIRDFGHLNATSGGTVKIEKDIQKIYEAIFKFVTARIRSNDTDKNFGQYRIATSHPGNGWYIVREQMGTSGASYYTAFSDTVSAVDGSNHYNDLNALTTRYNWYLYIKNATTAGYAPNFSDDGHASSSAVRPTRISKWKISVVSGSAIDADNSGDVQEYYMSGDFTGDSNYPNAIGKYFFFKPATTSGDTVNISSNYQSLNPSDATFEGTARNCSILSGDTSADVSVTRTALVAPSGNSTNGQVYLYVNQRYKESASFNTSTVYRCERVTPRLKEMELPHIADYDNRYDYTTFYGNSNYNSADAISGRRDHYLKNYIQTLLYNLYTLGRYYPVYSLATSVGSSQYNHGNFSNSVRGGSNVTDNIYGPDLYNYSDQESGTYYKVRGAGGASGFSSTTYYLVSDAES
tara:strand:- start:954 stop:2666 length:1713 start_codon:yes stop_codon:yes gene_type:complete